MRLDRRTFLQKAAFTFFTLLMSQTADRNISAPYLKTLAQPIGRKLALLVGINEYTKGNKLKGCVTDVELQKELLLYRFGFHPLDILTLTDEQATTENIKTAFQEHLIKQAQPDDVVVFHFSGYGTQVKLPHPVDKNNSNPLLMPSLLAVDGLADFQENIYVNNLLLARLWSWVSELSTEKLTIILDTSYSPGSKVRSPSINLRSLDFPLETLVNQEDIAFSQQLKQDISKSLKGTIFKAAQDNQMGAERCWNGFSAGLFTYALTQHLWEITPASTVAIALNKTAQKVERAVGIMQQPELITQEKKPVYTYYLMPETHPAQGIITSSSMGNIEIELVGLASTVLNNYGVNSCLKLKNQANPDFYLQIRSREGFKAKAKLIGNTNQDESLETGQLLEELYRLFPRNLGLSVALDQDLERIEKVDATSAFSSLNFVSGVVNTDEQPADCVFAKISDTSGNFAGYGLLCAGGVLFPNSAGTANEAIKSTVKRVIPQLKTILAAKILGLVDNQSASNLKVKASLELVDDVNNPVLIQSETIGDSPELGKPKTSKSPVINPGIAQVSLGSKIQYRIENQSDRPLYVLLLGQEPDSQALALCCPPSPSDGSKIIQPGETLVIPRADESINWIITGAKGVAQNQLIFSQAPFLKSLEVLANSEQIKAEKEQIIKIANPLNLAQALLLDLHLTSNLPPEVIGSNSEVYGLDVNTFATLTFIYEVI